MYNAYRKQIPRKLFFLFLFSILLIGVISAETFHQQNKNLTISFVSENLTDCFLGNTQYPDGTISIQNLSLNSGDGNFYLTIDSGNYSKIGKICHEIICSNGNKEICYEITSNGKPSPEGIVIVSFSIMFLLLVSVLLYFFIYTAWFFVEFKVSEKGNKPFFTIKEFLINMSGFFVLIIFNALERAYFGNKIVNDVLSISILISSFTNIFLPIIALVLSFTIASWKEIAGMMNFTEW